MIKALANLNFRDIGGLQAVDGLRLRHRMIYRSEGPASFLAEHRRELRALDIRLICDLRAEVERTAAPNDWSDTGRLLNLEVADDLRAATNAGWRALRDDPTETGARNAMVANYRAIPAALHPRMDLLIDAIVDGEYLNAAFDALARRWGSIDAYFGSAGLDADRRGEFRQVMLEPQAA